MAFPYWTLHRSSSHIVRHVLLALLMLVPAFMASVAQASPSVTPAMAADDRTAAHDTPGQFDYYLLDMPWGPVFCSSIKDVSATCQPQTGFVVHGLWPQNFDGTWPQFCAPATTPPDLAANLDLTPDLGLLQHEWAKHGTCSGLSSTDFFAAERSAFTQLTMPVQLIEITANRTFTPLFALNMVYMINPNLPPGSLSLSCKDGHVLSVEACFSKSLQPMRCQGLQSCDEQVVQFDQGAQAGSAP